MIEIELKFPLGKSGIEPLVEKLKKAGYTTFGRCYEKTVMYDNQDQLMQKTDGRVRLRASGDTFELCYKKPITRHGIKKELEHEVTVSNFETSEKILEAMDFTPTTSYERYRTTLKNQDGNIKVTIDEYPFSSFIEIEGDEDTIKAVAKQFGLDIKNNLTKPCDTLFQDWRKKKGLPFKPHMLFADYDR